MRRRVNDWALLPLTEAYRYRFVETDHPIDEFLHCFMEVDVFDAKQVRETIDCSVYMRQIPTLSPPEHLEMQQVVEARREAEDAREEAREHRAKQRRDTWIMGGLTMLVVLARSILAALIGRGIVLSPVG